jgi:hypothetical protein
MTNIQPSLQSLSINAKNERKRRHDSIIMDCYLACEWATFRERKNKPNTVYLLAFTTGAFHRMWVGYELPSLVGLPLLTDIGDTHVSGAEYFNVDNESGGVVHASFGFRHLLPPRLGHANEYLRFVGHQIKFGPLLYRRSFRTEGTRPKYSDN